MDRHNVPAVRTAWRRSVVAGVLGVVALGAVGCQEYELNNKPDSERPVDTGTPPLTTSETEPVIDSDTGTPVTTPPVDSTTDTGTPPPPSCDEIDLSWSWLGSPPFADPADPADTKGQPFHSSAFAGLGWSAVAIPDRSIDPGFDRAYRAEMELPHVPPALTISLQSDDGIWLWVNGIEVAHHGGDWQQEGCVNENAECLVTERVADIDITSYLVVGTNVIAARVSNAVENSYFELLPTCVD